MDAEELKLIMRESGRIYTDANKDKYLGTTLAKNIEGLLKKVVPLFTGFYLGLSDSAGNEMDIPAAIAGASVVVNGINSYVNQVLASQNIKQYLTKNIKTTTDKVKIRDGLDQRVAAMTQHERNNYALTEKEIFPYGNSGKIEASDFILKQYLKACESEDEGLKTKIVQAIGEIVIEDNLNLNPKLKYYLERSIHPRANYIIGGVGVLSSSFFCAIGYSVWKVLGSFSN